VCHLLHWPLSKIRQPRVIAEVIGGIILGPSVMGHIPGFTAAIFPPASIPNLTLAANIGLVLYLFIIGLETDVRFLVSNWRIASSVAFAGLALPFGLGCALAWGLYNQFSDDPGIVHTQFSTYMLFIGVAIAITVSQQNLPARPSHNQHTDLSGRIGFPGPLPYPDRIEAARYYSRYCDAVSRCRQRCYR
jgi:Kef-type K+ transport system membrane component KefB